MYYNVYMINMISNTLLTYSKISISLYRPTYRINPSQIDISLSTIYPIGFPKRKLRQRTWFRITQCAQIVMK